MAWKLYQLGRWCFRHRGRVVAGWLALLVLGGVGAATLSGQTNDTFELPSTESSQAFDLIKERTPQAATDGAIARVVVQAPEGEQVTSPANQEVVTTALEELTTGHVASVADPFTTGTVSPDGRTAYAVVSYDRPAVELTAADEDAMHDAVADAGGRRPDRRRGRRRLRRAGHRRGRCRGHRDPGGPRRPGHHVRLAGRRRPPAADRDHRRQHRHPRRHDPDRVPRAVLHHPALATMLGLAVGIDYALFVMSRYRHEVSAGREPEEAAGRAIGTAGSAVVFAGLTVVIALAGLSITGITVPDPDGPGGRRHRRGRGRRSRSPCCRPCWRTRAGASPAPRCPGCKNRDPEGDDVRTNGRRWVDLVTRFRVPALVAGLAVAAVISPPARLDGARPARRRRRRRPTRVVVRPTT